MPRDFCWSCRRPKEACLCPSLPPMETRTRIVLLMHPMEWKREKCTTGRLACLNLANSEIIPGIAFDENSRFRALVDDPHNYSMLLYPGEGAVDLGREPFPRERLGERRLLVFLIDATWACARAVARESPGLMALPRLMFTPREKSRWIIKRQPAEWCLSTLEATHELLISLEEAGLDGYPDRLRLLDVFARMQDYQVERRVADGRPRHLGARQERAARRASPRNRA
ncbi:MAG TPA: tRNA-uridine aminocarboxypropyltransferase [Rectinemataceae bacterium]|nr:tRNA-uridine aminocarboxypropyltransferase [Rectinemataceae bacterium]